MTTRAMLADHFLAHSDWADFTRHPMTADASTRSYERLIHPTTGASVILMNAAPGKGEKTDSFIEMAQFLKGIGLSAPDIFAQDLENGFLILEDLGDALFAREVSRDKALERPLYLAATEALYRLHQANPPAMLHPYASVMADLAAQTYPWYRAGILDTAAPDGQAELHDAMQTALARISDHKVTILRDFHAENLLWLPERDGVAKVGLLDFQDAMVGHPAYDLVSLSEDVRRDVTPALRDEMIVHYCDISGANLQEFRLAAHLCAAQRNLRILFVFARLSMHFGKPHYVDFIPRTWALLMQDLSHPALGDLHRIVLRDLPPPTPDALTKLKEKCATVPHP
ncbi:Phosphotransferase enzyme family protein [Aquimixticola soesokkakensis]|uniref:Phosphotransferase enzyme family protein n=1 Tax=Aquimixticola soesokkakensis TaxID=1519096 RepID=A0A1Y5RAZ2_9RHOB|nr:phosphotransferase [Aquimixticola soesokkakensis]SLN12089.1 Phosphotransferase enzyme family protein [Aquimixticola soesokkakensis]